MSGPAKAGTVDSTRDVPLGEAASAAVSSWLVQLEADGSWSGSVQPKVSAVGSGLGMVDCAYKDMSTGDVATAALTTDAVILIDGAGSEVTLSFTRSAGSMQYYATPIKG